MNVRFDSGSPPLDTKAELDAAPPPPSRTSVPFTDLPPERKEAVVHERKVWLNYIHQAPDVRERECVAALLHKEYEPKDVVFTAAPEESTKILNIPIPNLAAPDSNESSGRSLTQETQASTGSTAAPRDFSPVTLNTAADGSTPTSRRQSFDPQGLPIGSPPPSRRLSAEPDVNNNYSTPKSSTPPSPRNESGEKELSRKSSLKKRKSPSPPDGAGPDASPESQVPKQQVSIVIDGATAVSSRDVSSSQPSNQSRAVSNEGFNSSNSNEQGAVGFRPPAYRENSLESISNPPPGSSSEHTIAPTASDLVAMSSTELEDLRHAVHLVRAKQKARTLTPQEDGLCTVLDDLLTRKILEKVEYDRQAQRQQQMHVSSMEATHGSSSRSN